MLLNFPKVATEILNTDDDHVLQYPWYFDILRDTQPAPTLLKCCEPSLLLILEVSLAASDWSSISFVQKLSSSCYVGLWTWRLWPHRHPLISKDRKRFQFWRTNCISRRTRYEFTYSEHVITKNMYDSARKKSSVMEQIVQRHHLTPLIIFSAKIGTICQKREEFTEIPMETFMVHGH